MFQIVEKQLGNLVMDIGNENDPVFRLEQILDKKVEVVLICCSIGAITVFFIVLLVLRLVVVLLLRKNQFLIISKSSSLGWKTVYLI